MCKNHPARFWPKLPSRSGPDANLVCLLGNYAVGVVVVGGAWGGSGVAMEAGHP